MTVRKGRKRKEKRKKEEKGSEGTEGAILYSFSLMPFCLFFPPFLSSLQRRTGTFAGREVLPPVLLMPISLSLTSS